MKKIKDMGCKDKKVTLYLRPNITYEICEGMFDLEYLFFQIKTILNMLFII